jgi:hypothetical protein
MGLNPNIDFAEFELISKSKPITGFTILKFLSKLARNLTMKAGGENVGAL